MTLRARLFATSLAVALPISLGWFLFDASRRLANREEELRLSLAFDLQRGLLQRCEADPPRLGTPGRGGAAGFDLDVARGRRPRGPRRGNSGAFEYFAYDPSGVPTNTNAPPLPPDTGADTRGGFWSALINGPSVVVRASESGPCATLLARIPFRPGERRDQLQTLGLALVAVLAAAWTASGPLIRRLKRLDAAMRRSADAAYAEPVPVEGHDEIAGVARTFNAAARDVREHLLQVQSREAALREYVANTTHDVATPLTVLQGHLAALDGAALDRESAAAHVRGAVQEAHYMASLLRNLGAAARLDVPGGAVTYSTVDLSALVARVVARHALLARVHRVTLEFAAPDPPLIIESDATLLEQALGNLVDNAVRYNHEGGHVAVLLDRAAQRGGFVLSVTDDGPGVPAAELPQLATRAYRGTDARTRRPDGRGLGLAIAAEAVRQIGLHLVFSQADGRGLRAEISPRASASDT